MIDSLNSPAKGTPGLFFIGFFSFILFPLSFTDTALDPNFHLGFVLWSGLCFSGAVWFVQNRWTQKDWSGLVCHKLFGIGAGFCLAAWASLIFAENVGEGLFTCLTICLAGASLTVSMAVFTAYPQSLPVLCRLATTGAILLALLGVWGGYWQVGPTPSPFFFRGIMINKNLYAAALFLFTPFVIHTLLSSRKIWSRTAALLLPLLWILIFLSGSRGVFAAMTLGLVPVILLIPGSGPRTGIIAGLICIFLAFVCLFLAGSRFHSPEKKQSIHHRLALWHHTLQMTADAPVLGVGPGHWRLALSQYADPQPVETRSKDIIEVHAQRAHNIFLQSAAEIGVTGGLLYFMFFVCLYGYAKKILKKSKQKAEVSLVLAMIYGISGFLVLGMFSYPSERPLHTFLFMTMAGVLVSIYRKHYPSCIRPVCSRLLISVLVMSTLVCGVVSGLRLYSEIHLKAALQAKDQNAWHRVIIHIDKAFFPLYSIDPFGVPLPWYRGVAYFYLGNLPKSRENFRQAVSCHPFHRHSITTLSVLEDLKTKRVL